MRKQGVHICKKQQLKDEFKKILYLCLYSLVLYVIKTKFSDWSHKLKVVLFMCWMHWMKLFRHYYTFVLIIGMLHSLKKRWWTFGKVITISDILAKEIRYKWVKFFLFFVSRKTFKYLQVDAVFKIRHWTGWNKSHSENVTNMCIFSFVQKDLSWLH